MNEALVRSSIFALAELDYARSGGPGGQNVNKVNSKAIARIALDRIEGLSAAERERAKTLLAGRLSGAGELVVMSDEERDQPRNREAALARLASLVLSAARIPKRRRATKPTRASRERRLEAKHVRSEHKRGRGEPSHGEE
jgi:ribosome-associated protein